MNRAWATSPDQLRAFAGLSDVADIGGGGVLRGHRSDHAVARREVGCQRRADGDHIVGRWHRRRRHHSRVRSGRRWESPCRDSGPRPMIAALPALSCIDDLAGETVLTACEKALFGKPDSAAAALAYAASQLTRLTALGDVSAANKHDARIESGAPRRRARPLWPDGLRAGRAGPLYAVGLRRVPLADGPAPDPANMEQRVYDGLIARYAPSWNAPAAPAAAAPVVALAPSMPTGRPTNAEFPTAASTPPISIMTPEPSTAPTPSAPRAPASPALANAPTPSPRPTPAAAPVQAAAKKQAAQIRAVNDHRTGSAYAGKAANSAAAVGPWEAPAPSKAANE